MTTKRPLSGAIALALCFLSFSQAGCDGLSTKLKDAAGRYEGFLIRDASTAPGHALVQAEVKVAGSALSLKRSVTIEIAPKDGKVQWHVALSARGSKKAVMESAELLSGPVALAQSDADAKGCLSGADDGATIARVCFDGHELLVEITQGQAQSVFVLDRAAKDEGLPQDEVRPYTVAELTYLSRERSFDSRIQFEQSVQSRLESQQAHLNLTPHLSANDVFALISFNWTSIVRIVGDLAPFIFPENWYKAEVAALRSDADYYAWLVMKADSANITQGLAYAVLRDREALQYLHGYEGPITELRDRVVEEEHLGVVPLHSSDALSTVLDSLQQTKVSLSRAIGQENRSLAMSAGFTDPEAVTGLALSEDDPDVEHPVSADPEQLKDLVLARAPELKQINDLVQAAHVQAKTRGWFWMDPSGGGVGLGAGVPAFINGGKVPEQMLIIQRQRLRTVLLEKLANATDEVGAAVASYHVAKDLLALETERVQGLVESMDLGVTVSASDLELALQGQLKARMDVTDARYEYMAAASVLDRMILEGRYLDIQTKVNAGRPIKP